MSAFQVVHRSVVEVPARVMLEAMANCSGCAQSGLGLASQAYKMEYPIRTLTGIFEYDQREFPQLSNHRSLIVNLFNSLPDAQNLKKVEKKKAY